VGGGESGEDQRNIMTITIPNVGFTEKRLGQLPRLRFEVHHDSILHTGQ
jgi:hypothetical protein